MDGIVADEGGKRRLPLWMLGVAAADQVRKPDSVDVNNDTQDKGIASQDSKPKAKARTSRREKEVPHLNKEGLEVEDSSLLVKCQKKRRKRNLSQQDASCDGDAHETRFKKRENGTVGRKVCEAANRKRQKAKSSAFESSEEIEAPSASEDDGDLTVEDLMTIAKEYVKDDKDIVQQDSSVREQKEESQFPAAAFSKNESGDSLNAPQSSRGSLTHEKAASYLNSANSSTQEGILVKPTMTGDPTLDMLDLFLGPLLKKPLKEEKKVQLIPDDMAFAYELKQQNQKVTLGEEPAPSKKKSSLKDKVAMFLD